jgi:aspartate aminotransferase
MCAFILQCEYTIKGGAIMIISKKAKEIKPSSTLAITAKAKQMKADGIDVVGFGAGEPDFDTPQHIKDAAIEAINSGFTKYTPASGIIQLKEAICKKLKEDNGLVYNSNQIVVSNGAKHSLTNTFMAILNPGDEVIVPAPFWLSYAQMVKLADGVPVIVKANKDNNYKVTSEQLENALTNKTKAIIINSPSNPTGMLYSKEELEDIAKFAVDNNLFVISDEIYEKLIYGDEKHISIASLGKEIFERTIVINGVSKSYSMTGWRIGYAAASVEVAKLMSNMQSHGSSNPNSIAQKAALAAISGSEECIDEMKVEFDKRRNYMFERVNNINGISCLKPQGAFYSFVDLTEILNKTYEGTKIENAANFAKLILDKEKVAVIPCTDFGFDTHIRLSYAISLENIEKGLDRIESFVSSLN